jgi:4-amino-4-deoxy-L-arabinose transferase-like glycosyltransferase
VTSLADPAAPERGPESGPAPEPEPERGSRVETAWRLAPLALAALAAVAYLVNLPASGWANTYYSAAAQAASQSWASMFFGAIDAGGFITVDKPPVSLWVTGLSVRALGLSPLSVLLPQALAGIASVVILHATVRRQLGREAALIAGVAFALTPVAALIFRYNNPDPVLVLLLVAAAWVLVRGLEDGRLRWPLIAAVLVGFAFLAKYLQAYLVLPAFFVTYLVAAPGGLRRRIGVLAASGLAVVASSFWWVLAVDLVPAASRPYIGGSRDNTALDLVLGYDGLGRIFGGRGAGAPPGGPGAGGLGGGGFGGSPGWLRMFNTEWAGEISWLLPSAAAGLLIGLVARLRAPRTDPRRAAFLLWGLWAVVHGAVFSLMGGIVHSYYAVAIAPAAAALTGGGLMELWRARARLPWSGIVFGVVIVGTTAWAWQVLERTPGFWPGAGLAALFVAVSAAILVAVSALVDDPRAAVVGRAGLALGLAAMLLGPTLYTADTMTRAISGGDPAAGPMSGRLGGGPAGGPGGLGAFGGFPGDAAGTDAALVDWLLSNRGTATWLVAVTSAAQAGPLQLASGVPVMAMGGFMGSDPAPTVDELKAYVRDGRLRYVLLAGRGAGPGGFFGGDGQGNVARERSDWITQACRPAGAPSAGLYDCAGAG